MQWTEPRGRTSLSASLLPNNLLPRRGRGTSNGVIRRREVAEDSFVLVVYSALSPRHQSAGFSVLCFVSACVSELAEPRPPSPSVQTSVEYLNAFARPRKAGW